MAKYTTEVRSICESLAGFDSSKGYMSTQEIIENSRSKIFSFNYPIFDNEYKSVLETKILKHFYGREIGAETFGRWQLWLDARMNEIMPYYNKLYESELLEFNPFNDVDYTRTGNRDGENGGTVTDRMAGTVQDAFTGNVEAHGTGTIATDTDGSETQTDNTTQTRNISNAPKMERWDEFSDTPQGALTDVRNLNYLTNARHITEDGTGSSESGTVQNTGTTTNATDMTQTQTRNTTDTQDTENSNTRTYNTTDTRTNALTSTEEYLERISGKMGTTPYATLLRDFRDTFLNIDMLIINNLNDLFMGLW